MITKAKRLTCTGCQLARIDGIVCHEHGCQDAWRTETRECKECPTHFAPEYRHQEFCCDDCYRAYNGLAFEGELDVESDADDE